MTSTKTPSEKKHGGFRPGAGRPLGVPNKLGRNLKEAILEAAEKAGSDGKGKDGIVGYLHQVSQDHPGPFTGLLGRVLPMTIANDADEPFRHHVTVELVKAKPRTGKDA